MLAIERARTPSGEMVLSRRGDVFSIAVRGIDLMASNNHASEDELGRVAGELVVGSRTRGW